ncbi:MAG TPA: hypothetical protein VMU47_19065 [Caldimonas sp.]|nr:hypothetical protein [Caldimonas sp.]
MPATMSLEIAAAAARLVVEDGMEYGPAKRRAARQLGARDADLPDNQLLEDEVRAYLELYCADTQPRELAALRAVALDWMDRLAAFRPHLTGAVWRGTATRHSDVHLELYCDDPKAAELALIDRHVNYEVTSANGPRGSSVDQLVVRTRHPLLDEPVRVRLTILDYDDLRGALRGHARGPQRGDLPAVRALGA